MSITLQGLLQNFPRVLGPCTDGFTDQCAIRLSIALESADPRFLAEYPCWEGARCSHGHARSASRLAQYLAVRLGRPRRPRSRDAIRGKGIIYYHRSPAGNMKV